MIERNTIEEHLANINKRIDRLETGGRKSDDVLITPIEEQFVLVSEGSSSRILVDLNWDDNINQQPHGQLYWSLYVASGGYATGSDNLWPTGSAFGVSDTEVTVWDNLKATSADPNSSNVIFLVQNFHLPIDFPEDFYYTLRYRWVYLSGQAGVEAS